MVYNIVGAGSRKLGDVCDIGTSVIFHRRSVAVDDESDGVKAVLIVIGTEDFHERADAVGGTIESYEAGIVLMERFSDPKSVCSVADIAGVIISDSSW